MSSTNKTEFLGLNSWVSTDTPKRVDFNDDNSKIDKAIQDHSLDVPMHVSNTDRERWNLPYYIGFYYGNGVLSRTIETNCPFEPSLGIVFAGGMPPSIANFAATTKNNYFAFIGLRTGSPAISFSGTSIVINNTAGAITAGEYMSINNNGLTYCYIFFR